MKLYQRVVVDTSFLMDMRARPAAESDIIDIWIVSDGVAIELAQHLKGNDPVKSGRAADAENLLSWLRSKNKLQFVKDIGVHGVDDSLVFVALTQKLPLLSLDREMREHAVRDGVELVPLGPINQLALPLHVGTELKVTIDAKGRRKHQGVVEHRLGTIFVKNAAEVGSTHLIKINKIKFEDVSVILFAEPI